MSKTKGNKNLTIIFLSILVTITLLSGALVIVKRSKSMIASQQLMVDTWQTYSDSKNKISFKFPSDWSLEKSSWGGRDSYVVLFNKDRKQCVGLTLTGNNGTLSGTIKLVADGGGLGIKENNIVNSHSVTVNGLNGLVEQINYPNIYQWSTQVTKELNIPYTDNFYAAIVNSSPNYVVLTTCSLTEKETFEAVLKTLTISN